MFMWICFLILMWNIFPSLLDTQTQNRNRERYEIKYKNLLNDALRHYGTRK